MAYTDAEVARLRDVYVPKSVESVDALVAELGKSKRSVVGKLVSEGIYVAAPKPATAPRDEGPTKKEIVAAIEKTGRVTEVTGLSGATKAALIEVLALATAE